MKKFLSVVLCLMMLFAQIMGNGFDSSLGVVWAEDAVPGSGSSDDTGTQGTGTGGSNNPVTPAPTAPSSPRDLVARADNGQVTLTWSSPESDGGDANIRYLITYSGSSFETTATTYHCSGLTNGKPYDFEVQAINSAGGGGTASTSATPATTPDAPQRFTATPGVEQVSLSWAAPDNNGGASITGYEVSYEGGSSITVNENSHTFSGLTGGTKYTFKVRAVNEKGGGAEATAEATPTAPEVPQVTTPDAPTSFTATPGDKLVELSWNAPNSNGGAAIEYYEVSKDDGNTWANVGISTSYAFAALTNDTVYKFKVRAVNSAGNGAAASATATPVATVVKPSAPQGFSATPGDKQVELKWSAPSSNGGSDITKYEVSSDGGKNWVKATTNTSHTFTGLVNGTSYTFKVRAVNSKDNGDEATTTATPAAVPSVPLSFTATPGDKQVELKWSAPNSNGGSSITKYEVSSDNGSKWVTASSNTSHTFTGLTNGTSYTFKVRAVNSTGPGAEASASATPALSNKPSEPQNFNLTPGNRQMELKWSAPSSNGGSSIIRYEVSSNDGGNWVTAASNNSHTFTGLTNGTSYTFRVRAVNNNGSGADVSAAGTPTSSNLPGEPQSFVATPGVGKVELTWTSPSSNGGSSIIRYEVSRDGGKSWIETGSSTSYTFTDLTSGTSYTFRVRAVNYSGSGSEASVSATPLAANVPSEPRTLTATPGNGKVELKWTAPSSTGGSSITKYEVTSGSSWVTASSSTSHTFTGLTNGSSYTFKVRAVNKNGNGAEAVITATPIAVPSVPQSFTATPGDKQMELKWTAPASTGGSSITRYEVSSNNGSSWVNAGNNTSYTFTGLTNGSSYTFKVRAVNSNGNGEEASVTATPNPVKRPGMPLSFTATSGNGKVELKWSAPNSDGGGTITKYEVSSDNGKNWVTASSTTSHTFTGLTNGTGYTFKVRAVNSAGYGDEASVTATPAALPGMPQNFTATPGDKQAELKWAAPSSNGGSSITHYEVSSNNGNSWIKATSNSAHTFTGLTNNTSYTFKVRAVNSSGSGDAATASATLEASVTPPVPQGDVTVKLNGQEVGADLDANGTLQLNYTEADIARYSGGASGVFSISVSKQNRIALNIPISALGNKTLQLSSDFGEVRIPSGTLLMLREQFGDVLRMMIQKGSFRITLLDSGGNEVAYNNPAHPMIVSLPYTISGAESASAIVAVKVASGQNIILPYAVFEDGFVTFEAGSSGIYDLIYNAKNFGDTASHWANANISFVTAREIFSGTGTDRFSPDSPMTRAMFATVLARLDGADLSVYTTSRFNDVATDQWYAASVEWAADKKIVSGTGSGGFDPNSNITREQMAVMLNNYINYKGYQLPFTATNTETAFADEGRISDWANESVQIIRRAGIIGGKPGNLFDPQGVATRGEVATIFTRFVEMRAE